MYDEENESRRIKIGQEGQKLVKIRFKQGVFKRGEKKKKSYAGGAGTKG